MRPRGLALALSLLAACTKSPPRAPRLAPEPVAAPRAIAPAPTAVVDAGAAVDAAPPPAAPGPWASAWTDPAAVARLAADCNFRPPPDPETDEGSPLLCATDIEQQSCSYDPCHENVDLPCRRGCGRSCTSCDARCRGACGRCRASCHDEACVRACAASCGQCLQGCLTEKDRCLTAGCTARYQACFHRSVLHFRNGPCLASCTRCGDACPEGDENHHRCLSRCLIRERACTAEEREHCAWDGQAYGRDYLEELDAGVDASP